MSINKGFGFAPAAIAVAPAFGPAAPVAGAVIAIGSIVGTLFGIGGTPKYDSHVVPLLQAAVRQTGLNCWSLWFGEVKGLQANGAPAKLGDVSSITQYDAMVQQYASVGGLIQCGLGINTYVNGQFNPADPLIFWYPGGQGYTIDAPGAVVAGTGGSGGMIGVLLGIGALYLFTRGKI